MTTRPCFAFQLRLRSLALVTLCTLTMAATRPARAQTYHVLYNFTGGSDGANPYDGLTMDGAGNLYGTAISGGYTGGACASDAGMRNGVQVEPPRLWLDIHAPIRLPGRLRDHYDAAIPIAGVTFRARRQPLRCNGSRRRWGCSYFDDGCGAVFKLPSGLLSARLPCVPGDETVIYRLAYNERRRS